MGVKPDPHTENKILRTSSPYFESCYIYYRQNGAVEKTQTLKSDANGL